VTPLEHLHYSQDAPVVAMEAVVKAARGYKQNVVSIQTELMFGEDLSSLHTLVNMVVNNKINHSTLGQKYISPVDSEDFSEGVL